MFIAVKPPQVEERAVLRYSSTGTRGPARAVAGAALTLSSRKYTLPVRWKGRRVWFLKPRFVGWQHLVTGAAATVRITTKGRGKRRRVACVSAGPFAMAAEAAIATLQSDPRLSRRPYKVSSLSVSALMVQALWLQSGSGDRYWILEPSHRETVRSRPLTRLQFEASLRRAFRTLAADIGEVEERLSESAQEA